LTPNKDCLRVTNFEALVPADVAASEEIHPTQCLVDSDGSKASPIAEIAPAGSAFMENVLANGLGNHKNQFTFAFISPTDQIVVIPGDHQ